MRKALVAVSGAMMIVLMSVSNAFATGHVAAVTGAASSMKDDLVTIGTTVLPYAAAVLVISLGWRFARKFLRG